MRFTVEDAKANYAERMRDWSDNRLRHELSYVGNEGSWAPDDLQAAWDECLNAEKERRGLVIP